MEKMNTQLIKLQGDVFRTKKQLDESNAKVLVMTSEKLDFEKEMGVKTQQIEKLKNLCRELQKGVVPLDAKEPGSSDQ
jgi:non-homologous end joining protein Ku